MAGLAPFGAAATAAAAADEALPTDPELLLTVLPLALRGATIGGPCAEFALPATASVLLALQEAEEGRCSGALAAHCFLEATRGFATAADVL